MKRVLYSINVSWESASCCSVNVKLLFPTAFLQLSGTIFGRWLLDIIWLLLCELCSPRSQPLLIEQWRVANAFVQLDTIVRSIYKLPVENMDSISSFYFLSFSFSGPGAPFSQTKADLDQL